MCAPLLRKCIASMSVDNAERHHRQHSATILLFPILSVVIIWPVFRCVGVLFSNSRWLLVFSVLWGSVVGCGLWVVVWRGKNERFSEEMARR